MDVKGANPFLFTEDDYVSPNSANSNPFLLANDDFAEDIAGINDNPFLSQNAATMASSNNSTNPFAFDPMDFGPMEAQSAEVSNDQTTFMGNTFIDASAKTTAEDLFTSSPVDDFFSDNVATLPAAPPQKPTDLDLKFTTSNNDNFAVLNDEVTNQVDSQKMPPPRPPPSKETQDLLMSVMGAMDATSSHLLDRIPPTRTPSPVSMRDLHSPSPTPEPFGDLLDVSDAKTVQSNQANVIPNMVSNEANIIPIQSNITPTQANMVPAESSEDLMSLDQKNDINENPATVEKPKAPPPQRPSPPVRPPRPNLPPPKPAPPVFSATPQIPPQKPPPLPPNLTKPQHLNEVNEMMDMFGSDETPHVQKTVASTTDIMNLYNAPVMAATDLLCDTGETAMDTTQTMMSDTLIDSTFESIQDVNVNNASSTAESTPTPQPIIQDNFVSPEPSQSDLQMDTSDSQSKGSVSSVTFNPFAVTEDNNISPVRQNDMIESTETENVFRDKIPTDIFDVPPTTPLSSIPPHVSNIKQDDSFDAFAMKFESAAQDENKNGGAFDAFDSNNGVTDTWGNTTATGFNEASSGFGPDESFDAFLAMQTPPVESKPATNRFMQAGSMDSDEDKDFSVIIR